MEVNVLRQWIKVFAFSIKPRAQKILFNFVLNNNDYDSNNNNNICYFKISHTIWKQDKEN
jgi:hypothetical protein